MSCQMGIKIYSGTNKFVTLNQNRVIIIKFFYWIYSK